MGLLTLLCHTLGCTVVAYDYRLLVQPHNNVSAIIDDVARAFRFVLTARGLTEAVVAGDSAGGAIAINVARRIQDGRFGKVSALLLFSPWVDLDTDIRTQSSDDFLTAASINRVARYVRRKGCVDVADLSPVRIQNIGALPPTHVVYGGGELLRDQIKSFIQRMRDDGGVCISYEGQHQCHVFPLVVPFAPETAEALKSAASFLDDFTHLKAR